MYTVCVCPGGGILLTACCHLLASPVSCGLRGVMRPWFDFWFWRYIYCLLVYIACFPFYPFFFTFTYLSFPLLIFSFENRPASFPSRCRRRRWTWLFCVVVHFFWLVNVCFCCVRFSFFHTEPRDLPGEISLKWPILWRVGHKITTQSEPRNSMLGDGCIWLAQCDFLLMFCSDRGPDEMLLSYEPALMLAEPYSPTTRTRKILHAVFRAAFAITVTPL